MSEPYARKDPNDYLNFFLGVWKRTCYRAVSGFENRPNSTKDFRAMIAIHSHPRARHCIDLGSIGIMP